MATEDYENIFTLADKAMESIGAYRATGKEESRHRALEQVTSLMRALEKPADLIYKLFQSVRLDRRPFSYLVIIFRTQPTVLMAIKIAYDLGIFALLSQSTSFVTCGQLAFQKNADIQLVGMFFRTYTDLINIC